MNKKNIIKKNPEEQEISLKLLDEIKEGAIVKGKVLEKGRAQLFVDLGLLGIGLIQGQEFKSIKKQIKTLKIGDEIEAQISSLKNKDGYIELSLNENIKAKLWELLKEKQLNKESIRVKILEFNRGGLLTQVEGFSAFLPLSQLSSKHYPRVKHNNTSQIIQKLQEFIGETFIVTIIDLNEKEEKIIVSEKDREIEEIAKALKLWQEGEIIEGTISGLADFGLFIKFSHKGKIDPGQIQEIQEIEGFLHKSEIDWKLVTGVQEMFTIGEKVKAKIIKIENEKVFLSFKALKQNPWERLSSNYKKNDEITGKIIRFLPYGAFVIVEKEIQGLVHISNFNYSQDKMKESLMIDKEYKFQIMDIDIDRHRLILKFNQNFRSDTAPTSITPQQQNKNIKG